MFYLVRSVHLYQVYRMGRLDLELPFAHLDLLVRRYLPVRIDPQFHQRRICHFVQAFLKNVIVHGFN